MVDKKDKKDSLEVLHDNIDKALKEEGIDRKELLKAQFFTKMLNKKVEEKNLEPHPIAKNMKYLPISFMEMALDELFFGQWNTVNFKYQQVANELIGDLTLEVFNPITKIWIKRIGADSIQIMVDEYPADIKYRDADTPQVKAEKRVKRNQWALNKDNKKPAALSSGQFAALKAFCFKNACVSIGQFFGRDVNRKFFDRFSGVVEPKIVKITELKEKLSEAISLCQDRELAQEVTDTILKAEHEGTNEPEVYTKLINKLSGNG